MCGPGDEVEFRRCCGPCGQEGDGTALLARGAVLRGDSRIGEVSFGFGAVLRGVNRIGEVSFGFGAEELACCSVVGTRGLFSSVKAAEPDAGFHARVADLSYVPSPGPFCHASITDFLRFRVWVNGSVCITRILWAS
ncbi:hypothetical protein ACB094_01G365200 [Castanea mollissima]